MTTNCTQPVTPPLCPRCLAEKHLRVPLKRGDIGDFSDWSCPKCLALYWNTPPEPFQGSATPDG